MGGHSPPQKPVVPSSHALRPATRIRILEAAKGVRRPLFKSTSHFFKSKAKSKILQRSSICFEICIGNRCWGRNISGKIFIIVAESMKNVHRKYNEPPFYPEHIVWDICTIHCNGTNYFHKRIVIIVLFDIYRMCTSIVKSLHNQQIIHNRFFKFP